MVDLYAHTTDRDKTTWQSLPEHSSGVSIRCGEYAAAFSAQDWGLWCGMAHDLGKASVEFQHYLEEGGRKVDHSTAGSRIADEIIGAVLGRSSASIASFVVAGHHAGLPNGGASILDARSLCERLHRKIPDCRRWSGEMTLPPVPALPLVLRSAAPQERGFAIAFFIRMLFSCLTDADYLDTEEFCDPERARHRMAPQLPVALLPTFDAHMADLALKPAKNEDIARWRQEILGHCRSAAQKETGVFSLTVPTGGGKTLSSLAFALEHAKRHGLRRIVYVIPFTSIIEQNAAVFRDALGDEAVLEHHSAYISPEEGDFGTDEQATAERTVSVRLASENWDASVIVTTAVQFFESLFANRSSRCRKLHNIAKSVVILDEAQMLPPELLNPSVMALRELVRGYGTSVVLCTATQPALDRKDKLSAGFQEGQIREIIPADHLAAMFDAFQRVRVTYAGRLDNAALTARMCGCEQVLCIVNTRGHARELFDVLGKDNGHFHLSALMYPAHRKKVLDTIRQRLKNGERCRVVSTSLVEAGVDVDFPSVFRAATGLDSIAQAAGRCNREGGRDEPGEVTVFVPEKQYMPETPYFRRRAGEAEWARERHEDVLSPAAIHTYFSRLYEQEDLDAEEILSCFESAFAGLKKNEIPGIPFRSVAEKYRFIKDEMEPLIIECDEALPLVETLEKSFDPAEIRKILRRLQVYTVQVYPYQMKLLLATGNVRRARDRFPVLLGASNYSEAAGLVLDDPTYRDQERNMY